MKNVSASPRNRDAPVFSSAIVGYGQSAKQIARRRQLSIKWKFMVRSAVLLKIRRICSVVKLLSIKKIEIEENTKATFFYKWKDAFLESQQAHQYSSTCNLSTEISIDSTVIQTPTQYKVAISTMNMPISTNVIWKSMSVRLRNRQRFRYFQAIHRKYTIYQKKRKYRNLWIKLVNKKKHTSNKTSYKSIKNWDNLTLRLLSKDEKQRSKWHKFTSGLLFRRKTDLFRKEAAKLKWISISNAIANKNRSTMLKQVVYLDKWHRMVFSFVDLLDFYQTRNEITNEIRPYGSSWLSIHHSSYINKLLLNYMYAKGTRNDFINHKHDVIAMKYDWCRLASRITFRNNVREAKILKDTVSQNINHLRSIWNKFATKIFIQEIRNQYEFVLLLEESKIKIQEISKISLYSRFFAKWSNLYQRRFIAREEKRLAEEKRLETERKLEEERRRQEEEAEAERIRVQEERERERARLEAERIWVQEEREKELQKIHEERERERAKFEAEREALRLAELERERQKVRALEEERERERARIAELEAERERLKAADAELRKLRGERRRLLRAANQNQNLQQQPKSIMVKQSPAKMTVKENEKQMIIAPGARPAPNGIPLVALKDSREVLQVKERVPLRTTSPIRRIRPVASAEELLPGSPAGSLWLVEDTPPPRGQRARPRDRVAFAAHPRTSKPMELEESTEYEMLYEEEDEEENETEVSIEYGAALDQVSSTMFDATAMQSSFAGFDGYTDSDADDVVNEIVTINVLSNLEFLRESL